MSNNFQNRVAELDSILAQQTALMSKFHEQQRTFNLQQKHLTERFSSLQHNLLSEILEDTLAICQKAQASSEAKRDASSKTPGEKRSSPAIETVTNKRPRGSFVKQTSSKIH